MKISAETRRSHLLGTTEPGGTSMNASCVRTSFFTSRLIKGVGGILTITTLALSSNVFAQSKSGGGKSGGAKSEPAKVEATPVTQDDRNSDRLDVKKLEQQYWSPKDDDFTVVQNRAYSKANRFGFGMTYGVSLNDSFSTGKITTLNGMYYFSEKFGIELTHLMASMTPNDTTTYFQDRFAASPDYTVLKSADTITANWVPFYGKMSLLEKKIVYFDMSFGLGLGFTNYSQIYQTGTAAGGNLTKHEVNKAASHIELDITQHFFLTNYFAFRFSFKNQFSKQEVLKFAPASGEAEETSLGERSIQNTQLLLGVTFFY
jgi:outer membrane beta-barrel protein